MIELSPASSRQTHLHLGFLKLTLTRSSSHRYVTPCLSLLIERLVSVLECQLLFLSNYHSNILTTSLDFLMCNLYDTYET